MFARFNGEYVGNSRFENIRRKDIQGMDNKPLFEYLKKMRKRIR